MGVLIAFASFMEDIQILFDFFSGFWNALPIVLRLLVSCAFGAVLLIGIYRIILR